MRYEDYKVENYTFTTKEDWTMKEMEEFLETCPETKNINEIKEALIQLREDIRNDVIKKSKYYIWYPASLKKYASEHPCIHWRDRTYDKNYLFVFVDGEEIMLGRSVGVDEVIKKIEESDIATRFERIKAKYIKKEEKHRKAVEEENYEAEHKDRIKLSDKLYRMLNDIKIEFPGRVYEQYGGYYTDLDRWSGWDYTHTNNYGELTMNKKPIFEEDLRHIEEVMAETIQKLRTIKEDLNAEMRIIEKKYREV